MWRVSWAEMEPWHPGLLSMVALRAGAYHVTCVERWLYLSLTCKEIFEANRIDDSHFHVIYKRPTDLQLLEDVKVCCNLLICEMFDEGQQDPTFHLQIPVMSDIWHDYQATGIQGLSFIWQVNQRGPDNAFDFSFFWFHWQITLVNRLCFTMLETCKIWKSGSGCICWFRGVFKLQRLEFIGWNTPCIGEIGRYIDIGYNWCVEPNFGHIIQYPTWIEKTHGGADTYQTLPATIQGGRKKGERQTIFAAGLLTSGLLPVVKHAVQSLMTTDMVIIPASATVFVQAVESRTGDVCAIDMSGVNVHRWHPAYLSGAPVLFTSTSVPPKRSPSLH